MPVEGSKLNYTLAGFSVPEENDITEYEFKIAKGTFNDKKQFEKNIILVKRDTSNKTLIKLPSFGTEYTWQVTYLKKKKEKTSGKLFHFATDTSSYVDEDKYRLRVLANNYADSNLLFFVDYSRVIYNLKGEPVWFLPARPEYKASKMNLRDMDLSPQNTITFVTGLGAYETDIDGNVLWTKNVKTILDKDKEKSSRAQRESLSNAYHHDFTKTSKGTYMCLQNDTVLKKICNLTDIDIIETLDTVRDRRLVKKKDGYYLNIEMGKLVEYDKAGNMIWQWRSSGYFTDEEILGTARNAEVPLGTTHMNAFFFNEKDSSVYIGFRNVSNIVRVKYPTNEIIASYGGSIHGSTKDFFVLQHSCRINTEGDLYVFNNDVKGDSNQSKILIIKVDTLKGEEKIVWEFGCAIDDSTAAVATRGGNVVELADGSMLCCMGTTNRIFIVDKDKQVLFNALSEQFLQEEQVWTRSLQYRANPLRLSNYFELMFNN